MADAPRRLRGDTWVFAGITNSGWTAGVLLDTGPDAAAYDGFEVRDVAITHGHADHFSAAPDLRRAGARVIAPREEAAMVENPEVNIRGMFSWALPSDAMVTKLFRGEGCKVDVFVDAWRDEAVEVISLPGHTLGHSGYLTRDGVLMSGDCLYERDLWERHPLPYSIDPGLVAASLRLIGTLDYEWLVPGHGVPVERAEAGEHIEYHLRRMDDIAALTLELLAEPKTTEQAIAGVSGRLGLPESPAQYWLAVTTVKSYLSWLLQRDLATFYVQDHAGYWAAR